MIGSNTSLDKIFHRAVIFDPQLRQARPQERQLHISRQLRRMLDSALPGGSCSEHRRPLLSSFPCSLPDPHVRRPFPRSTHGGRRLAHGAPFRRPSTSCAWTVWHVSCDPARCTTPSMASVLSSFRTTVGSKEGGVVSLGQPVVLSPRPHRGFGGRGRPSTGVCRPRAHPGDPTWTTRASRGSWTWTSARVAHRLDLEQPTFPE